MEPQEAPSEYETRAAEFLAKHKIEFAARFLYHGPHFDDEKETRNVWELTLAKRGVSCKGFSIKFGDSIANSFLWPQKGYGKLVRYNDRRRDSSRYGEANKVPSRHHTPTAYDMLACLTKYNPGSFANFCGDMGLDTDSRKAKKTYDAVMEEWEKVERFFTREELEELAEIS